RSAGSGGHLYRSVRGGSALLLRGTRERRTDARAPSAPAVRGREPRAHRPPDDAGGVSDQLPTGAFARDAADRARALRMVLAGVGRRAAADALSAFDRIAPPLVRPSGRRHVKRSARSMGAGMARSSAARVF